eukprot:898464-Rhodomonas_salina.2
METGPTLCGLQADSPAQSASPAHLRLAQLDPCLLASIRVVREGEVSGAFFLEQPSLSNFDEITEGRDHGKPW